MVCQETRKRWSSLGDSGKKRGQGVERAEEEEKKKEKEEEERELGEEDRESGEGGR